MTTCNLSLLIAIDCRDFFIIHYHHLCHLHIIFVIFTICTALITKMILIYQFVERVFQLMDHENSGKITIPEILDAFGKVTW